MKSEDEISKPESINDNSEVLIQLPEAVVSNENVSKKPKTSKVIAKLNTSLSKMTPK